MTQTIAEPMIKLNTAFYQLNMCKILRLVSSVCPKSKCLYIVSLNSQNLIQFASFYFGDLMILFLGVIFSITIFMFLIHECSYDIEDYSLFYLDVNFSIKHFCFSLTFIFL